MRGHAQKDRRQNQQRQYQHRDRRLRLMPPQFRLVIKYRDANAVECMVNNGEDQPKFADGEKRRLISGDGFDVQVGIKHRPRGVDHVQRQEEHHADAGEPMQHPTPLPDRAAVTQRLPHR